MLNQSLFSGGVYNGSLRGLMDYALLYAGSSFTVGVAEEEGDTMPLTKMADAPEGTHIDGGGNNAPSETRVSSRHACQTRVCSRRACHT